MYYVAPLDLMPLLVASLGGFQMVGRGFPSSLHTVLSNRSPSAGW